jgi:hypothetical protein
LTMDAISRIENLNLQPPSGIGAYPVEDPLTPFLQAIDKMVADGNSASKAIAKAAILKAEKKAEFERKLAYLTGQILNAKRALASIETPSPLVSKDPADCQLRTHKEGEVLYWENRLRQVCSQETMEGIL